MQARSDQWDQALAGSFQQVVQVDAWYDGELIEEDLQGVTGSVSVDSTQLVQGSSAITAADDAGKLIPVTADAIVGCYGTQLHVRGGILLPGGNVEIKSLGWFRIDTADPAEQWQQYMTRRHARSWGGLFPGPSTFPSAHTFPSRHVTITEGPESSVWVPRGTIVETSASDLMILLDEAQFLAPEQPASLASVIVEIQRLCQGVVPVADFSAVTDAPIPRTLTYDTSRSGALTLLADVLNTTPRMNPDGALELIPTTPSGDPVWAVAAGSASIPPISQWKRHLDRAGIFNAVVLTGTDISGNPIQGIATLDVGPLRHGGPFGRVVYRDTSQTATSNAQCTAEAQAKLEELSAQRTVVIPVIVPTNYALQGNDVISIGLPDRTLQGPVTSIQFPTTADTMPVGVEIPRDQLWAS
jgi:hypothetical protein